MISVDADLTLCWRYDPCSFRRCSLPVDYRCILFVGDTLSPRLVMPLFYVYALLLLLRCSYVHRLFVVLRLLVIASFDPRCLLCCCLLHLYHSVVGYVVDSVAVVDSFVALNAFFVVVVYLLFIVYHSISSSLLYSIPFVVGICCSFLFVEHLFIPLRCSVCSPF
jgi:hypothetical protein